MKFSFVALVLCAPALAQTTIHVPGDAPTIQAGLELAVDGDTVLVAPGVYSEGEIRFGGGAVTLGSSEGPAATVIQGTFLTRLLRFRDFEGPDSVVEGFTFRNGQALALGSSSSEARAGGAIAMLGSESPTIRDCIFIANLAGTGSNGSAGGDGFDPVDAGDDGGHGTEGADGGRGGRGGAIFADGGHPTIERCIFFQNSGGVGGVGGAGGDGGDGAPSGFLTGPGDGGDGARGGQGGAGGDGGALAIASGSMTVLNCLFIDNRSGRGGFGGSGGGAGAGGESGLITQDGDPGSAAGGGSGGDGGGGGTFWVGPLAELVVVNSAVTQSQLGNPGFGGANGSGSGFGFLGEFSEGVACYELGAFRTRNSIYWDNPANQPLFDGPNTFGLDADVAFCNVQVSYPGQGNFSSDPLWVDAADPLWSGFQIGPGSPCVDAGSTFEYQAVPSPAPKFFDLARRFRTIDLPNVADALVSSSPAIDVGPFEVVGPPVVDVLAGCGLNVPGSLTHVAGQPTLGSTITIAIHNPLGTQSPGSL
ncbi:MAG: hypothetical protein AAFZ65_16370, partial [Planctomycetota bacterium]